MKIPMRGPVAVALPLVVLALACSSSTDNGGRDGDPAPGDPTVGDSSSGDGVTGDSAVGDPGGDTSGGDVTAGDAGGDSSGAGDTLVAPLSANCPNDLEGNVLRAYDLTAAIDNPSGSALTTAGWSVVSAPPGHSPTESFTTTSIHLFADAFGAYTLRFEVANAAGRNASCETVLDALTDDVLRVELSWNGDYDDSDGPDASDLDLYLMRDPAGQSPGWYYLQAANPSNPNSCHWANCPTCTGPTPGAEREHLCREALANPPDTVQPGDVWPTPVLDWDEASNPNDDPRLDLDDSYGHGPEVTSVRLPAAGTYRVAVHYYRANGYGTLDANGCRHSDARVRILCAGEVLFTSEVVDMRSTDVASTWAQNDLWEVGDVTVTYGGGIPACSFTELGSPGDRTICKLDLAVDGCATAEARVCD
jgi:hypothetical protein